MILQIGHAAISKPGIAFEFNNRINLFYKKFDIDVRTNGVISQSYAEGLTVRDIALWAIPTREGILRKVISIAIGGSIGRKLKINME